MRTDESRDVLLAAGFSLQSVLIATIRLLSLLDF